MNKITKLVIATGNEHKMIEYKELFKNTNIELLSLNDINANNDVDENGKTYFENSLIKAKSAQNSTNLPIIADDSGIEIHCLNNFPGLHTARFAKEQGGHKLANLEVIKRVNKFSDRGATFRCVITLLNVEDEPLYFEGVCPGHILNEPQGEHGFGYDPIFYSEEAKMPFGLASKEIKNQFSHRAKAVQKLIQYFKDNNLI